MSIIRDMLYNGMSLSDPLNNNAYNQNFLQNFIRQHQPSFILHCGSSDNVIRLALFLKQHHQAEILYVRNWNPGTNDWLHSNGTIPNPHQNFLDRIEQYGLEDILISFDGYSTTAAEVLAYRGLSFDMMISDSVSNNTDYLPLQKLLKKQAIHIRYMGDKKLTEIKNEKIFELDSEASFCFAQGYLIIGVDYLSLYEETTNQGFVSQEHHHAHHDAMFHMQQQNQSVQSHHSHVQKYYNLENFNDYTNNHMNITAQAQTPKLDDAIDNSQTEELSQKISAREQRMLDRQDRILARQKRREERQTRRENRSLDDVVVDNHDDEHEHEEFTQAHFISNTDIIEDVSENTDIEEDLQPDSALHTIHHNNENDLKKNLSYDIEDDGSTTISAARKALRARHAARRLQRRESRLASDEG